MSSQQRETEDKFAHARSNAAGWLASIEEMLDERFNWQEAAEAEGWTGPHKDQFGVTCFKTEDGDTWACADWKELCNAQDIEPDETNDDEARERIQESVLSVQVRGGWHFPGEQDEAEEYEILLSTGGPALRITGELGAYHQPSSAEMEMQDWFTPWTPYNEADEETLLTFARYFYFGG